MFHNSRNWTIILLIVVMAMATASVADPAWVSLDGTPGFKKPTATVTQSNTNETVIRFTIPGYSSEYIDANGDTYQSLRFPGHFTTMEVGKAQLPVMSEFVAVPRNVSVRADIIDYTETTMTGYRLYPYQRLLLEGEQPSFEIDDDFYRQDGFYPETKVEVGEPGTWRHIDMANLRINPVRYNPATGELKVLTDITIKLEYTDLNSGQARVSAGRSVNRDYDNMYRRSVLNYDRLGLSVEDDISSSGAMGDGYEYLIITASSYAGQLDPFVAWKNQQGLRTEVVPITRIGADTAAIKAFITDEYYDNNIEYVLLVGNEYDIPGYELYLTEGREDTIFCDYYYSLIDGDDDFADIAIGRFSVENSDQVVNMINKTITYESNPVRGDWLDNVLLVANQENAPDKYQGCSEEIRTAQSVSNHVYDVLSPDFTTAYGAFESRGGDEASNADVLAAINSGQRVVNYRGHGSHDYWSYWNIYGECFNNTDAEQINTMGDLLTPVVFSIACWNSNLRHQTPCLGEAFTRRQDAAVAFLGASIPSYTVVNHEYNKSIFEIVFNDGLNTIGNVSNQASIEMIRRYHEDAVQNARGYLWLGDPSLNVIFYGDPGPAAPQLVAPDNGATATAQPTLVWNAAAGATGYEIVIDNNPDFQSPEGRENNITGTDWLAPVLETGTYYWRVRAISDEIVGAWSDVRTLNVGIATPVLYSPANDTTMANGDSLQLVWHEVDGVSNFEIQIDDDPAFGSPVIDDFSADNDAGFYTYHISPRLAAGTYYWRVKGDGLGLSWSDVWQFTLPESVGDLTMHVADMRVECLINELFHFTGVCSVMVVDQNDNPVPGVDVECYWKKYEMEGTAVATTNDRGIAEVITRTINDIYAPFCFTITDVNKVGVVYDPTANLVTKACEHGWVYKDIPGASEMPNEFMLAQNYPNPFNPVTEISFSLPTAGHVSLGVYNIKGQKVAVLVDRKLSVGSHTFTWDGSGLASGIYIYQITTGSNTASRKMLLLK